MPLVPRLTDREHDILRQLTLRGKYGLELVSGSNRLLTRNSIYVYLNRMHTKGFVRSRLVETPVGETGPPRRLYRITTLGRRSLAAAVAAAKAFNR